MKSIFVDFHTENWINKTISNGHNFSHFRSITHTHALCIVLLLSFSLAMTLSARLFSAINRTQSLLNIYSMRSVIFVAWKKQFIVSNTFHSKYLFNLGKYAVYVFNISGVVKMARAMVKIWNSMLFGEHTEWSVLWLTNIWLPLAIELCIVHTFGWHCTIVGCCCLATIQPMRCWHCFNLHIHM